MVKIFLIFLCLIICGCEKNEYANEDYNDGSTNIVEKNIYTIEKEELSREPLKNYVEEFKEIIDAVKKEYPDFNENDYLVNYLNRTHTSSDNSFRQITFIYAINNSILTNSTITIFYSNGKITDISTSNIEKKEIDVDKINDRISKFELNKKEIISKEVPALYKNDVILNSDNSLSNKELNDDVINFKEFYFYDFNEEKLIYKIEITKINQKIQDLEYMITKEIEI